MRNVNSPRSVRNITSLNSHFAETYSDTICRRLSRGGVGAGSIALVAGDVKSVADELGLDIFALFHCDCLSTISPRN